MSTNIVVPEVGESVVDARVAKWLKQEGDAVAAGEALVELETDKVDVEVAAPKAGVLKSIAHKDGADVKIGDVLGTIDESAGARTSEATEKRTEATEKSAPKSASRPDGPASSPVSSATSVAPPASTSPATPSARRLARENDVPLASVQSSGPRVTRADVEKSSAKPAAAKPAPAPIAAKPPSVPPRPTAPLPPSPPRPPQGEERVRMSKRRATIAKRLVEAQHTAAMLTTFNEVDMSAVMTLRERQKEAFKAQHGVSLGIASFFVKAAVAALREFPRLNAEIQGDEMVIKRYYDIGIAVGAAEGLVVPVLRGADQRSFAAIEAGIRDFATRAKDGTLTLEDLRGGSFSITNGGVYGSLMSTPILNPPQVGILGLHAIKDRPAVVAGQIVVRPMMYTALTYDHRIVDGAEAVQFLVRVKQLVEDPAALLLQS